MLSPHRRVALLLLALLGPLPALGAEAAPGPGTSHPRPPAAPPADTAALFDVSTAGSSTRLKAGEKGLFVLTVRTREGAYVSNEAPLKLVLKGSGALTPAKSRLSSRDSVARAQPGKPHADPRFEVPFSAASAGRATLEAKLTFFLCMEERCERKERSVSLPIEVL